MPGLSLTAAQAGRLWALDGACCDQVLGELMDAGFLRCSADGRYRRNTGGDDYHWRRRVEMSGDDHTVRQQLSPSSTFAGDVCEAFAGIIAAAARADGSVLPCEMDRLEHTLNSLPVFRGRSQETIRAMIERVVHRPPEADGALVREATAALPADLRGTAFAVGIDILLADGRLRASELVFVEELRRLLRLRRSVARKVLGVLGTKNLVWIDAQPGF
jgi:tellurite resistance protein